MSSSMYDTIVVIWLCLFCSVLSLFSSLCRLVLYCVDCCHIIFDGLFNDLSGHCVFTVIM
jgi:hypothetical protein